jgi:hypothetical protein
MRIGSQRTGKPRLARVVAAIGAALLLVGAMAGSATAATVEVVARNEPIVGPDLINTWDCPGLTVREHLEGERSRTNFYNNEGALVRTVVQVRYTFTFTNVDDPGQVARSAGHRHIVLDYERNTFTETGIYRNVTMPGEGNILQVVGRSVSTLDTEELIQLSGPHEDLEKYCAALAG